MTAKAKKKKDLSLSELVAFIGQDKIKVQNVMQSVVKAKHTKGGTQLTIETEQVTTQEVMEGRGKMFGLVLWMPHDKVVEFLNR